MSTDIEAPRCCAKCTDEKAADQFRKFGRGRKKVCIPCEDAEGSTGKTRRTGKRKAAGAGKGPGRSKKKKALAETSRWEQPGGFGFAVQLQVDEKAKQTDIHLEQTTPDLGTQNIWLSQHEARSLQSWLNDKLGTV